METNAVNIRALALEVLTRCEAGGYSNINLDTAIKRHGLGSTDKAFLSALVYGVIERKITLDYIISSLSSISQSKIERDTRNILRLGIYQLRYMDRVPSFASVNETVALANKRSKSFVNALLRAYTRKEIKFPDKNDEIKYLSVCYSVGESLVCELLAHYGFEKTESILGAFERKTPLTLRVNTLKCSRDILLCELRKKFPDAMPTPYSPDGIILQNGAVSELECLIDGRVTVQDEASQICTGALGARRGETVLDVCACPGGKSFSAAMAMENDGEILAFDIHENKLSLVKSGAERLGISIILTEAHDARVFIPKYAGTADKIICDVPCSGFGVIAKKPEIRYKNVADSATLPQIQLDILENVSKYLKVGGTLVYSTCTILPDENENNVKKFLAAHPDFELVPFSVGGLYAESGMITLLPDTQGTDGFFIAKLTKTA